MNSWKVFSLSIFLLIASIGHAQVMKSIMYKKVNYFSMDNTQKRADKRYVKPGTHILGFSVSNNQHPLILHDPSVLLKAEHSEPINKYLIFLINGWSLNYQYSFPENFFVEGNLKYMRHGTPIKLNDWVVKYAGLRNFYESNFSTISLDIGGGYRFVGKNNLRFFDVHAGFSIGMTDNPVGNGGGYSEAAPYVDGNGNKDILSIGYIYRISSRMYYGFYLGISKDIRITENLYLTARYHYQFGKKSTITEHLISYDIPSLGIKETVRGSITGKGEMLSLGLKWYFDND